MEEEEEDGIMFLVPTELNAGGGVVEASILLPSR